MGRTRGRRKQRDRLKEEKDDIQEWLDKQVSKSGDMDVTPLEVATLLRRAREDQVTIARLERRLDDVAELLEESMIEHGSGHAADCERPCSCGYASLVKARRAAALR